MTRTVLCLFLSFAVAGAGAAFGASPPTRALSPALAELKPVDLLPVDLRGGMTFRNDAVSTPSATATWSKSTEGVPVLRVENFARPKSANHVSVKWNFRVPAKCGDVVLARFFARAEYARQESGEAMFELTIRQEKPDYAAHVKLPLTAGPEWTLLEVPFTMARDADTTQGEIEIAFGIIPQAVEIAGFEVLDFGDRTTLAALPQTRFTYKGREAGAAWREAALARIETIRTAPIHVRVIDAAAHPVAGARVEIRLARPTFAFGTSVDASFLLNDTPDAKKYRDTLLACFDTAVIENGFKWPVWSSSPEKRAEALRAFVWLESQGMRQRGHCLVWPGNKFSPRRVVDMAPPKAELPTLIHERIRDVMTATRGRIVGWDVINELLHERDYLQFMPESEAAEWFKIARATDPHAKLFLNEYAMLNSRNSPAKIADYLALLERLRSAGAPIDALGVQGHVGRQVRAPEDVLADLDLLAKSGLELQITEFDINSPDEELQADYTRDFLIALYSHPSVTGFTNWGFWQKKHWKPDAAMFRADWTEKPNGKVWRELVRGQWLTQVDALSDSAGQLSTRGHLGDYVFTASAAGQSTVQMRAITKDGATITLQIP
jgi:GH35 family endo-1,4-beta-xylanase